MARDDYKGYMSHNPPTSIIENGVKYVIYNTFKTRSEVNDELEFTSTPRSWFKVKPHFEGFAVYINEDKYYKTI